MPAGALIIFSVDLWHPLAFPSSQIGDLISNPQHIQLRKCMPPLYQTFPLLVAKDSVALPEGVTGSDAK
jgi:hypothetical protein